ncbi:MAG: type I polyketide synthase, partial [Trebonia sp.]
MASPIALVGIACRFPGGVYTPESLWRLVSDGKDAIGRIPVDRGWNVTESFDAESGLSSRVHMQDGYFLRDPYGFDADFFGISPKEARATDPQQRIILELAWEAVERAGIAPPSLRGSRSGVFVGCSLGAYYYVISGENGNPAEDPYWGTGTGACVVSGRVSYTLGLEGPAITVDTGCSSALVALHLACHSLRLGECDLALAGGVTVMTSPDTLIYFNRQRALAPDGRCKPFAAGADGTSFAEGAGVLVAERLSDARRLGHPVLAVVKGSALSQDGATSNGLTAPSTHGQIQAIRAALRDAGLNAGHVDAVEAHGTGTVVGDPIEANALIETYGQSRRTDDPVWVGSVKSNIGHTQCASGAAGVIKMVLAMRYGQLPGTLHIDRPTPRVDWNRGAVALLTAPMPWPERGRPRRAGVSSFGISGTNAHVILEEAPVPARRRAGATTASRARSLGRVPSAVPILLSAKSEPALRDQARRLAGHPECGTAGAGLADLGRALATTRGVFDHRAVIIAPRHEGLLPQLRAVAGGKAALGIVVGRAGNPGQVAYVFPGQGAQWPGMATALLAEFPVFAKQLADCDDALAPYADWSLMRLLRRGPDQAALNRVDMLQPMLFAIAVSLAALWRSLGVAPDAVVGHSQGEVAAAYACGALSLDDAARISALRAKALSRLAGTGAMASLPLSVAETQRLLPRRPQEIEVAAVNGPASTVVAGPNGPMDAFIRDLLVAGVEAKRIPVDYASHSAQVEEVRDELDRSLGGISPRPSTVPFYSTVTAGLIDTRSLDAAYWWDNLRQPVRFADALRALGDSGFRTFVETSPHPVLGPDIRETLDAAVPEAEALTVVGSLSRD